MKPYYEDDWTTIYHADCREVLPMLSGLDDALVLTDPPYGIAGVWKGGAGHGWGRADGQKAVRNEWDGETPDLTPLLAIGRGQIVWGGNYFNLPPSRGWLVWNKPERGFTLSEAEMAWTSWDTVVRVFDFRRSDPGREHPTQKPLELMQWCLSQPWTDGLAPVLDPYMGSGTTLVAAKNLGRRSIGIEVVEEYCETAARRLSQGVLNLGGAA